MLQLFALLNNDNVKKIGAALGLLAGGIVQLVPSHTVAFKAAAALLSFLGPLGLVSGGTKGAQPTGVLFAPQTGNAQSDAG